MKSDGKFAVKILCFQSEIGVGSPQPMAIPFRYAVLSGAWQIGSRIEIRYHEPSLIIQARLIHVILYFADNSTSRKTKDNSKNFSISSRQKDISDV